MKAKNCIALLGMMAVAGTGSAYANGCAMPGGKTWINDLGSTMEANVDASGEVSGTYTTAVGCGAGKPRKLTGFCNGHAVTFSVNWQECVSTTSWSGTYDNGEIATLWHLVLAQNPSWNSIVAGTDRFEQQ